MATLPRSPRGLPLGPLALATAALAAALGAGACFSRTTDVTLYRPQLPRRPDNCDVSILPRPKPDYAVEDLARVSIDFTPGGRDVAMNRLKREACYYGGDTLYDIGEKVENPGLSKLAATIARRPPGAPAPSPETQLPSAPTAPPSAGTPPQLARPAEPGLGAGGPACLRRGGVRFGGGTSASVGEAARLRPAG
jgi:hypothetical protein